MPIRMFNLHLITLGKLKEVYWQDARVEYLKRLKPYAKLRLTEIPEESFRDQHERAVIQQREAEKLRKCLPPQSTIIACHEQGKNFDSVSFAKFLAEKSQHGDELAFIIGVVWPSSINSRSSYSAAVAFKTDIPSSTRPYHPS